MMKSFFKKLAFVMALAMVVSSMAPAATAKAADNQLGICLQDEAYTAVRTSYEMTEGDEPVDFKFAGAPPEWRTLGLTWDSSDKTVAEVSQAGVVTAKAVGTTKITIASADGAWAGEMALTVKEKVEVPAYEVKQTASDKLTITWADAKNATTNVEVYKIYKLTDGNKDVKWPSETKLENGVATVTVKYGGLEDGADYVVKFGTVEHKFTARVGKVSKIEVTPVASEWDATANNGAGKWVDAKGLYVTTDEVEYPIRFVVTYITDNNIKLTTAPENTNVTFEVMEGGDDIYLDGYGVESYIYEKDAWAYITATYYYTENDEEKTLECDFFIGGEEKETAKLAGITKYTFVAVGDNDQPSVNKADTVWNNTEIIVDDRAYVALEVADSLGGTSYVGLKDANYGNKFGVISYLSANDEVILVGADGLVTPVSTGTTSVIVQLATYNADGDLQDPKPIYAFDVTVKESRAAKDVTANSVVVLTNSDFIASKANVEIKVTDNYEKPWTGWTATLTTTTENAPYHEATVTDSDNDGKATFQIDGSLFPANTSSVTYKVTVGSKSTTFKVTLKNNASVSGYVAEVGNVTVDGKASGVINGEVKVYSFWRSAGVVYKLANVTEDVVIYDDAIADFWTKNTEDLKGKLVVTVKNPGNGDKYTAQINGDKIVVPGVANVDTTTASGGALTVTEGTYSVVVNKVMNTSESNGTFKVTRKSVEDEKSFTVTNAAKKIESVTISDAETDGKYYGNSIKDVIAGYATFKFHGDDEYTITADKIVAVDCIENEDAGKIYVKTIKVKVPVYDPENEVELNCFFEQTLTINKLLPCDTNVFAD